MLMSVRGRTERPGRRAYPRRMPPRNAELALLATPRITYEWAKLLLARAHFNGTPEKLAAAWRCVLGYRREAFCAGQPVIDLTVAGQDSAPRRLRLHRRFDRHGYKVFVIADPAHERIRGGLGALGNGPGRRRPST